MPPEARPGVQELDISLRVRARAALSELSLQPGSRVGDLGCGTGWFSAELARGGYEVMCVDISQENLDELQRIYPDLVGQRLITPIQGDLTELPLDSGTLDGVCCMEVLEHVENDRRALREIVRVLKPGGALVLSVPNRLAPLPLVERLGLESVHDRPGPERHVRPGYEAGELTTLLSEAGFDTRSVSGVGGMLYRATTGLVSLAHLGYRRARGQPTWTWADVEQDAASLPLRLYRAVFPGLLFLAELERGPKIERCSALVVTAVKPQ